MSTQSLSEMLRHRWLKIKAASLLGCELYGMTPLPWISEWGCSNWMLCLCARGGYIVERDQQPAAALRLILRCLFPLIKWWLNRLTQPDSFSAITSVRTLLSPTGRPVVWKTLLSQWLLITSVAESQDRKKSQGRESTGMHHKSLPLPLESFVWNVLLSNEYPKFFP